MIKYLNKLNILSIVRGPNFVPDLVSSPCLFLMKSREICVDFTQTFGRVKFSWLSDFFHESMTIGTLLIEKNKILSILQNSWYNI